VRRERATFAEARRRIVTSADSVPRVSVATSARTLVVVPSMYQTGAHFAWMALAGDLSHTDTAFLVGGATALHDVLVGRGFDVVPLADGLATSSARDAATFVEALRHANADVVHLDGVECVPWAGTVRGRGARVVQHVRLNALERFRPAFIHADAIVAVSPSMRAEIEARVGTMTPVVDIADGVDLETYAPRDPSERPALTAGTPVNCLVAGRVEPAKRQLRVIDIFEALAVRRPARLTLVGSCGSDATYCDEVLDRIEARPGDIAWRPFSPSIAHLYREAHVVLVGSRNEALGMVGLEALAAGALLVAHRSTGYAHIVDPARGEGLLFDEHESAGAVAARVAAALDDLGAHATAARRKAAEAFDARATVRRLRSLWDQVAARR
jgi:glycosyltransferase involved in cell wall biosynthesis